MQPPEELQEHRIGEAKRGMTTYRGFHEKGSLSYLCALGIDR